VQFDGEGEAANARPRAIGGHPAAVFRGACLRKDTDSPYANSDGYVLFGKLVDYAGGRSNGCTSWSRSDAEQVIAMMKEPTTLYIYPESDDIAAVAQAVKAGRSPSRAGLYWNASCLKEIGTPKFWPKETLEPIGDAVSQGICFPCPRARDHEERHARSRMHLADTMFDGPSLPAVKFLEIGDGHGLRISECRAGYWISFSFCSQPIPRRPVALPKGPHVPAGYLFRTVSPS
jgi:hypothetical protein